MASLLSPRAEARRARGLLDVGREVRHLLHLADLDDVAVPGGAARRPLDRLCLRLHLDQPVPADHLLGLGEGPEVRGTQLPDMVPTTTSKDLAFACAAALSIHFSTFCRVLANRRMASSWVMRSVLS